MIFREVRECRNKGKGVKKQEFSDKTELFLLQGVMMLTLLTSIN